MRIPNYAGVRFLKYIYSLFLARSHKRPAFRMTLPPLGSTEERAACGYGNQRNGFPCACRNS